VYITEFYKKLFGAPSQNFVSLDESETNDIPQLTHQENENLIANFSEQEVYDAIFQMEKNKAPGPDGFSAEFYQKKLEVLKGDLMALFKDF
jgi:mannosylglycoprotein endo-beta-mannosidase